MEHKGLVAFGGVWPNSHQENFEAECDRIFASTALEFGISGFKGEAESEFTRIVGMSTAGTKGEDYVKAINEIDPELFDYIDKFRENDKCGDPILKDFGEVEATVSGSITYKTLIEASRDESGNPVLKDFSKLGKISANTLRYVMTLAFLRKHFSTKLDNMTFVEIGGGYGGLCKVISCVVDFKSYTLIDLPSVVRLQRKYLEILGFDKDDPDTPVRVVHFYDSENIDVDKEYDICISEYCISEFDIPGQEFYIDNVIGKSKNAYLLINFHHSGGYNHPDVTTPFMDKLKNYFDIVELIEDPEFPSIDKVKDGKYIICKDNKNL